MLEADEVDDDYFTPTENTAASLANIFAKSSQTDESKDSTTLKYVPLPPPSTKTEEVKPTKWIFTCVVHGFEWSSSGYINRGKLGLAILKVMKTNSHSIVLYDSNKSTLSCATISSKLKLHIRDDLNVSYYDDFHRCWNIQTSNDDINNMLQVFKNLQVTIVPKSFNESVTGQEQSDKKKIVEDDAACEYEKPEIDTDSYVNQMTKDSILRRMANMGHSVLPPHCTNKGQTSDSSGGDDTDGSIENNGHKLCNNIVIKSKDLSVHELEANIASCSKRKSNKSHIDGHFPFSTKNNFTNDGNNMNIFITEQKISNSELRINVNRMSDKIDLILEKITDVANIDKKHPLFSFQNEIVQKLMREYESKIKSYEDFLSSRGIDCHSIKSLDNSVLNSHNAGSYQDIKIRNNHIEELRNECMEKEKIIAMMKDEIKMLNEKIDEVTEKKNNEVEALLMKMHSVTDELKIKNDEIVLFKKKLETVNTSNSESGDTSNKIKKIMNNTFQAISATFSDEDTYAGEIIKTIIATVIKKTTIEALKEL